MTPSLRTRYYYSTDDSTPATLSIQDVVVMSGMNGTDQFAQVDLPRATRWDFDLN